MLQILERPRRASSDEDTHHAKAKKASDELLGRLRRFHAEVVQNAEPVIETVKAEALPPIPNEAIAFACDIASSSDVFSRLDHDALALNIAKIQRAVLREFPKMTMADLNSPRREAPVVRARQIAMYIAKKVTAKSLPEIGRRFGGRDHTTVLHAVRKIDGLIESDPKLAALVQRIKDSLPEYPV